MSVDRPWDAPKPAPAGDSKRGLDFWIKVAGVVLALGLVGWCSAQGDDSSEAESANQFDAKDACHAFVERQLKAPGTADFSQETATEGTGGEWTVAGVVDSENSFGGEVRNGFRCTARSADGGANWTLVDLQIDGN